jgi:phosphoribosylformylglycinamidine synthase PurS subunit
MKIIINVDPKENILDPQGKAVHQALTNMGFANISEVRIGKHMVLNLPLETPEEANEMATAMCEKLLCNPLIEEYSIVVES